MSCFPEGSLRAGLASALWNSLALMSSCQTNATTSRGKPESICIMGHLQRPLTAPAVPPHIAAKFRFQNWPGKLSFVRLPNHQGSGITDELTGVDQCGLGIADLAGAAHFGSDELVDERICDYGKKSARPVRVHAVIARIEFLIIDPFASTIFQHGDANAYNSLSRKVGDMLDVVHERHCVVIASK